MTEIKGKLLNMRSKFSPESGVLILEPLGPLNSKDFDRIDSEIGPWIRTNERLLGVVIHARTFPGWSGFAALVRHVRFARTHRRDVRRVALAVDGSLPAIASKIIKYFIHAETKVFGYGRLSEAVAWATKVEPKPKADRRMVPDHNGGRFIPNVPGF